MIFKQYHTSKSADVWRGEKEDCEYGIAFIQQFNIQEVNIEQLTF